MICVFFLYTQAFLFTSSSPGEKKYTLTTAAFRMFPSSTYFFRFLTHTHKKKINIINNSN